MNINVKEIIHELNPSSKEYREITLQNLQSALQTTKGAKIVSLVTVTIPDLKVNTNTLCKFDYELLKVSYINGIINFNYAAAVNKQREREGKEADFVPSPRKWGTRLKDSPFISHVLKTGEHKLYLEVKIEKSINHIYYIPSIKKIISDNEVKPYLREKPESKQDVEKEIVLRDYNVANIAAITVDGQGYFIE